MCQEVSMQPPLTVEKCVAMEVMKLAFRNSYHYVDNQFGIGKTTVGEAIWDVYLVIQDILSNYFIHLINPQEAVTDFNCMGFPNCVGAMDGTQIPILCPAQGVQAFIHQKGYFSIILQGTVDHKAP
ncbi:hypothetical protein Y1Q_0007838 [Alligator mississippiensis]|uniref:DDE Tnp4 domain-containing protein n=1 Tax=Alligator mississippiensis TaxID=8496 RepID=A0A151N797_ALLMI|nr:hypothetical protein Y1Q_0007838 [Alligator mississippiensis]